MPEPRWLLVKCSPDEDFYVAWSDVVEAPIWCGTRTEASEFGYTEERLNRADDRGTTSLEGFYRWDSNGMIAEQRGWLPRRNLLDYALRYTRNDEQAAFDLLEPFEGETEVRR